MSRTAFLSNGHERAIEGIREHIRQRVEARFAEQLRNSGPLRRLILRVKMSRLIGRRYRAAMKHIDRCVPPDALYIARRRRPS